MLLDGNVRLTEVAGDGTVFGGSGGGGIESELR